jgi:mycothione reductase
VEQFDLIVVGTGSGNAIPAEFDGWRIALIERDVFGGTCLNRGCIPSKMFVYAADVATLVGEAARYGIQARLEGVDWPAIVKRVFGRIDPIAAGGEEYRTHRCPNITVVRGSARLVEPKVVEVAGRRLTAPHVLLAAGARPVIPGYPGLAAAPFHTSDTIMRLAELPRRLVIVGGGYIAAELGHVFGSFGVEVTFVLRSGAMLRQEDDEISARATELIASRHRVLRRCEQVVVGESGESVVLTGISEGGRFTAVGDALLVAAGRTPNGDELGAAEVGIACDGGRILTDDTLATNVAGVWALGDLTNTLQLKHLANAEAKVVFHNIARSGPESVAPPEARRRIDRSLVPHAVFGHPQVAAAGLAERDAAAQGLPYLVSRQDYGGTAYGWAMEDHASFCKLVVHAETRKLLGAHIVGPQASTLIQPLIQGMRFGQTVDEMGRDVWYIHPALSEVVENALLSVPH